MAQPMLEILPPETIQELLADFECPACLRQLRSHTPVESQTCLSFVTLIHQVGKHNSIHPTN